MRIDNGFVWVVVSCVFGMAGCSRGADSEVGVASDRAAVTIDSVTEQATLTAPVSPGANFGADVAVSGNTLLAGAELDGAASDFPHGSAFVFDRAGGTWSGGTALDVGDPSECIFGMAVALEGDTALVSGGGFNCGTTSGAVYVFNRSGASWIRQQKLVASDPVSEGTFGFSLALDDDTAVIGATATASAYVFVRSGGTWTQQAKLTPPAFAQSFGWSVAISGDIALVGAPQASSFDGAAYVFVRSGGAWSLESTLTLPGPGFAFFGTAVAVDGETALIGADGSVRVYERSGATWLDTATLVPSGAPSFTAFGSAVAFQNDVAIIGAQNEGFGRADQAGAAYVFARDAGLWTQAFRIVRPDAQDLDNFASAVALDQGTVAIAQPRKNDAGAVFVYTLGIPTSDGDGDGVPDDTDQCPATASGSVVDTDGCSIDDHCPCAGPAGTPWPNHGAYVTCVVQAAHDFEDAQLISSSERQTIIQVAAQSDCGNE